MLPLCDPLEWGDRREAFYGAPGEIRTPDHWYRKPVLYPLSYGGAIFT